MNKIKKYIYLSIGLLSLILGGVGIVLPILPTTPFLLLSSFCFAKGSDKFNKWFLQTSLYKNHLESFIKTKSMTFKEKLSILLFAETLLAIAVLIIENNHMKIFLIALMLLKLYYFLFKVKTTKAIKSTTTIKGKK